MTPAATAESRLLDLRHLGHEHVIGAWIVGDVVVDPGPSSCIEVLLSALADHPPRAIALTHIHLDHAGASGSLARRYPEIEVWVHERGAPHLIDPHRLIDSAARLYGDDMQRLWGEVLAVPADRVRRLAGGETIGEFGVAYTPGHASHHVSYLHAPSGLAFTGDVTGVRIEGGPALAPTPPPDIDLAAWRSSLELIERWTPSALAVTHFGRYEDVSAQLAGVRDSLERGERAVRDGDEADFEASLGDRLSAVSPAAARAYRQAMPAGQSFQGLARYVRRGPRRAAHEGAGA